MLPVEEMTFLDFLIKKSISVPSLPYVSFEYHKKIFIFCSKSTTSLDTSKTLNLLHNTIHEKGLPIELRGKNLWNFRESWLVFY